MSASPSKADIHNLISLLHHEHRVRDYATFPNIAVRNTLYRGGYWCAGMLRCATDEELRDIPGLGVKGIALIRAWQTRVAEHDDVIEST
jgi:hypothetical protein